MTSILPTNAVCSVFLNLPPSKLEFDTKKPIHVAIVASIAISLIIKANKVTIFTFVITAMLPYLSIHLKRQLSLGTSPSFLQSLNLRTNEMKIFSKFDRNQILDTPLYLLIFLASQDQWEIGYWC